jgi:hypothetical protein
MHLPPPNSLECSLALLRNQTSCEPAIFTSNATHLPSGETTEPEFSGRFAGATTGLAVRVTGSNAIVVEILCVTNSK